MVTPVLPLPRWRPPRSEAELLPLVEVATTRVRVAEADVEQKVRVRAALDSALATMRAEWARGRDWRPAWWPGDLASYRTDRALVLLEEAISACETGSGRAPLGQQGDGYFEDTCWLVLRACAAGEPPPHDAEARLQQARDRLVALVDELEQRQRGPGPQRPYRLLAGSVSRWEGDKATGRREVYRAGSVIMLDAWQAKALGTFVHAERGVIPRAELIEASESEVA